MAGFRIGEFITTKALGSEIHIKKKRKKKKIIFIMGHIINPLSLRIGWVSHWQMLWYTKQEHVFLTTDDILKKLLRNFFLNKKFIKTGIIYSHGIINRKFKRVFFELFLFDPYFQPFKRSSFKKTLRKLQKFRRKSHIWRLIQKKKIYKILSTNFIKKNI